MSLIDDARAAHKAGLSYGQYMTIKKPDNKEAEIAPLRVCEYCGAPLPRDRKKFCTQGCRTSHGRRRKTEVPSEKN